MSININFVDIAESMGVAIEEMADEAVSQMQGAVAEAAALTYNKAVELAGERLHSTKMDYINALDIKEEDGVWIVSLDPSANYLEDGYGPRKMLPGLAQGAKSRTTKDGSHRYTIIPIRQHTSPQNSQNPKQVQIASEMVRAIRTQRFQEVRRGINPNTGKLTTVERLENNPAISPYLQGLVRVREYKTAPGKDPQITSSQYLTFRVASENQDSGEQWVHPGYHGAQIFPDLGDWAVEQVEQIIRQIAANMS